MLTALTRAAVAAAAVPALLMGVGAATTPQAIHHVCHVLPGHWERKVWYGNNPGFVWVWVPPATVCRSGT
jgi:hypothetical protein